MKTVRVLLMCSSRLALPALHQLTQLNVLAGVVVPQHCDEWLENVQFVLQSSNIPVLIVNKETLVEKLTTVITEWGITIGLMVTFSFRLQAAIYRLPVLGFFNVHPGPLPHYRGADPIFQQIRNREKQAAVTIHYVSDGFDAGAIVLQERIRLLPTDTYGMLTSSLGQVAAGLILLLLKMVTMEVNLPYRLQDEAKAVYYKRHGAKEVIINWQQMDAATIVALIHACNPWNKGATTILNGRVLRLLEAAVMPGYEAPEDSIPGTILALESERMIVCDNNGCALSVTLLYLDEGYVSASRLRTLGFAPGHVLNTIL